MISNNISVFGAAVSNSRKLSSTSQIKRVYGLNYPIGKMTNKGYFSEEAGFELVRSMIRQAILTEQGERLMLPDFGCGLKRYLFEQLDEQTFLEIKTSIVRTLTKYVPGVDILKLGIAPLDKYGTEGLQALVVSLTLQIKELDNSILELGVEIV